jgi:hypothetical protein
MILLSSDPGKVFSIDDNGPLEGPTDINHFDRYAGVITRPLFQSSSAYVVEVPV